MIRWVVATSTAGFLLLSSSVGAIAAESDVCPITLGFTPTGSGSGQVSVSAPWGACLDGSSATWVHITVDGRPLASSQVRRTPIVLPLSAPPGAEVVVTGRRTMVNGGGQVVGYERLAFRMGSPAAPSAPTGLHAWGATDTSLALDWLPPANADDAGPVTYLVRVGDRVVRSPGTEVVVTGLDPRTNYAVEVVAEGAGGTSQPSVTVVRTDAEGGDDLRGVGTDPQSLALTLDAPNVERNSDGSADLDGDPVTVQQTLAGAWLADDDLISDRGESVLRMAPLTAAGMRPKVIVTYMSPSISDVDVNERTGLVTATLGDDARTGAVILTVHVPAVTVEGTSYEALTVSRRVSVSSLAALPTSVNDQVTDVIT